MTEQIQSLPTYKKTNKTTMTYTTEKTEVALMQFMGRSTSILKRKGG